jgi:serine kinase of HPr protein (carbohydrate metabolism regulator)
LRRRWQAAAARGLTRFVGRQTELEVLQHALARAEAGHGHIVAIVGEAGVGKSRLMYECVHWRDCVGAGRSPFPATASAEGAQLNVPPSLRERVEVRGFRYSLKITHTPLPQHEIPPKHSQSFGPRRNRQCENSLAYRNHSQAQPGCVAATAP